MRQTFVAECFFGKPAQGRNANPWPRVNEANSRLKRTPVKDALWPEGRK